MNNFDLVSLSENICPGQFTYVNSRGGASCLDTFLVSSWLYSKHCVIVHEVIDFLEHGSDHCPVYVRLRVHPKWSKKISPITKRILKTSGLKSLSLKMSSVSARPHVLNKIKSYFSHLDWASASSREDMNDLWQKWANQYALLTEELIGTRRQLSVHGVGNTINLYANCARKLLLVDPGFSRQNLRGILMKNFN